MDIKNALPGFSLQWSRTQPFPDGGFWTLGEVAHGRWEDRRNVRPLVEQFIGMVALPDGTVFWFDRCRAAQAFSCSANLSLPIRLAADIFNGEAARLVDAEGERVFPQHSDCDTWHRLSGDAIAVDNSFTIQNLEGGGAFHLMQKRRRDPERQTMVYGEKSAACEESLIAHDLYFGERENREVAEGEWFRRVAQVLFCIDGGNTKRPAIAGEGENPLSFVLKTANGSRLSVDFKERKVERFG